MGARVLYSSSALPAGRTGTAVAVRRALARKWCAARVIRPEDCRFEIRGRGNATRQIIDIMPPAFPSEWTAPDARMPLIEKPLR